MVEPISAALTGIALVQKSVSFIKSNIATANDIKDIAGALDGLFAGEKQVQSERFSDKSMLGQTKDAASKVIDAKLAQEAMDEMRILINHRFGHGTFQGILETRQKRIKEYKEAQIKLAKQKAAQRAEMLNDLKLLLWIILGSIVAVMGVIAIFLVDW